ncbi:MAG: HlyD family efflux transporter periplasmic adaptor subunit [Rhodanobacteraceae bacterium]
MAVIIARIVCRLPTTILFGAFCLSGCSATRQQVLGTLEYDRITLPAPVAERIVSVHVREGQRVKAGQLLLQLDETQTRADLAAAEAQAQQQDEALTKLKVGARKEDIAKARANLASAEAQATAAHKYYARLRSLKINEEISATELDNARAAASNAKGQVDAAHAALDELLNGNRPEDIAEGEAALAAALAQAKAKRTLLGKLSVVAPRAGRVDNIPYKVGDQAPVGAPLAILLVGDAPYARIYVPERQRASVHFGDVVHVFVDGRDKPYAGRVRMIRSEPVFTPYYALIGEDATRLSYIAEVSLGADAADLPAGLPVRVESAGRR